MSSSKNTYPKHLMEYEFGNEKLKFRRETFENWVRKNYENPQPKDFLRIVANYCTVRVHGEQFRFVVDEEKSTLNCLVGNIVNTKTDNNFLFGTRLRQASKF